MGVHGLWRLLDSFGNVIQPDELKGKRVAIDASIWIAQFRARTGPGEDAEHKVLEGFLARILKLLFYGIRPVFVFDGTASVSKDAEHDRRMRQRVFNAQALLKRKAKQILMAQVAAGGIDLEEVKAAIAAEARSIDDHETEKADAQPAKDEQVLPLEKEAARQSCKRERESTGLVNTNSVSLSTTQEGKHHRHRRQRRRRRLAPEAVASRTTRHFLEDAVELLEERARHEARVLHNTLQHSSTSLFMGPRLAVEAESNKEREVQERVSNTTPDRWPSEVTVVEEEEWEDNSNGVVEQSSRESATALVVQVSERDKEASRSDSDDCCCTVSSTDSSDGEAVVLMESVERGGAHRKGIARQQEGQEVVGPLRDLVSLPASQEEVVESFLQSEELTRFLSALSQSTTITSSDPAPSSFPVATPVTSTADGCVVAAPHAHQPRPQKEKDHEVRANATCEDADAEPSYPAISIESVSDAESQSGNDGDTASTSSYSNIEGEDGSSSAGSSDEDTEGEEDEEEKEDAAAASYLIWEPFSQRLQPAMQQHLSSAPGAQTDRSTAAKAVNEDDEFTPVKIGRRSVFLDALASPTAATVASAVRVQRAVVLTVSSDSDEDHEDEGESLKGNPTASEPRAVPKMTETSTQALDLSTAPVAPKVIPHTSTISPPRQPIYRDRARIIPFELLSVVELLDCCGVPYVLSPAEADAQCAFLARHDLVDAVFTEDSDVLVHGATTVLRGFFSQSKNVVAYRQVELERCGLTKTVLVALAMLLGCDYTNGVCGIGLVSALEALVVAWRRTGGTRETSSPPAQLSASSSSTAVLQLLERWTGMVRDPPRAWADVDGDMSMAQYALFTVVVAHWHLCRPPPSFPETHAVEAFFTATVDPDTTPLQWRSPDWQHIRVFAGAIGAFSAPWLVQRFELAKKEWERREAVAATLASGQRRLTDYGVTEQIRASWALQKQPTRHALILAQLRAAQGAV